MEGRGTAEAAASASIPSSTTSPGEAVGAGIPAPLIKKGDVLPSSVLPPGEEKVIVTPRDARDAQRAEEGGTGRVRQCFWGNCISPSHLRIIPISVHWGDDFKGICLFPVLPWLKCAIVLHAVQRVCWLRSLSLSL